MQTTGNLGLKKPEGTDIVDIADLNGNMDILDNVVNGKVDKVTGKQLSTNDYTAAEKTKLVGIAAGANNYAHPNHTGDVTSTGDGVTAIAAGVIVNSDINAAAGIDASKIGTGVVSNAEYGYLDGVTSGIQGQLNGKAPLATTPQQTTADITYYVDATIGSDSGTGLGATSGVAFKTIAKAISMIPQVVNHGVTINIGAGTYNEEIVLVGYTGSGFISITGASAVGNTRKIMGRIACQRCTCRIEILGLNAAIVAGNAITILSCVEVVVNKCQVDGSNTSSGIGIWSEHSSVFISETNVLAKSQAIYAHVGANVLAMNCIGSLNTFGYSASYGGRIQVSGTSIAASIVFVSGDGGIVTTGTTGIINPWGDNTRSLRTYISSWRVGSQVVQHQTATKIQFSGKSIDNLNEWNNSTFTARNSGDYFVSLQLGVAGLVDQGYVDLYVFLNGGHALTSRMVTSGTNGGQAVRFVDTLSLPGGTTMEFYIWGSNIFNVEGSNDRDWVRIQRIG